MVDFRRLGDRAPSLELNGVIERPEEIDELARINDRRTQLYAQLQHLEQTATYVIFARDRAKKISEELRQQSHVPNGSGGGHKRDACCYDARLSLEPDEWAAFLGSDEARNIMADHSMANRSGICMNAKNRCKHREWAIMRMDEIELERRVCREEIAQLGLREQEIRKQQSARSMLDSEREGRTVRLLPTTASRKIDSTNIPRPVTQSMNDVHISATTTGP